jgi:hypothetical protein
MRVCLMSIVSEADMLVLHHLDTDAQKNFSFGFFFFSILPLSSFSSPIKLEADSPCFDWPSLWVLLTLAISNGSTTFLYVMHHHACARACRWTT